jgi:Co/Zn/Cd efflux system component
MAEFTTTISREPLDLGIKEDISRQGMPAGSPSIHEDHDYGVRSGIQESPIRRQGGSSFRINEAHLLSPASAQGGLNSISNMQGDIYSPPHTPNQSVIDEGDMASDGTPGNGPFNFVPVQYTAGKANTSKSEAIGKRRGHKYRHSSVHASHMEAITKTPTNQQAAISVPASLPMPTRNEAWWSMNREQTKRLAWCVCHFFIAGYVQAVAEESLALTALSRLLLFDAAAASVCVAVDIMGNFEVWQRSSIKHPFGLERADVLAGFAMAVFIVFMGLDIISHGIQHSLENVGSHVPHSSHHHERVTTGNVDIASILAVVSTLVSAFLLKNHGRIGKAMHFDFLSGWGKVFGNPSHFLTVLCSVLLLILPFLPGVSYDVFDKLVSFLMAGLMIALGVRLGTSLASMLLMSFNPPSTDKHAVRNVIAEIVTLDPAVTRVEEARFWQVHYGLCMANLKLRYRDGKSGYGAAEDVARIRQRVTDLIKRRFDGMKWEVSIQLTLE